jgi:DNA-binding CsgD family transcriptional regulator
VSRLVLKRFGEPAVAAGLDTVCAEATRGNPALLFALFNDLEQHVDKTDPTGLAAHVPTASPSRLVHSIAHLASTVGPDSLIILQAIALLDSPAEVRDIAEVSAVDPRIISPTLERLTEVGILEAAEPIRFVHPLVKSALIGAISVSRRRSLHMRCAKVLLRKGHPEAAIAAHVVETEPVGDRNSTRILLAGCRHEIQEGDLTRAERMLSRAEAEAPELRDDPALLIEVAEMHARLGHPEALDYLRRAEHATPNPAQLLPILFALADAPGAPELATVLERLSGACRRIDLDSRSRTQVDLARCLVPDPQAAGAVRALQPAQVDDPPLMHALRAIQAVADPRGARAADLSAVIEKHVQPSDLSSADPVAAHIGHRAVIALTRTGHSDVAERLVAEASEASAACNGATAAGLLRLRALIGLRRGNIELARACLDRADRHNPSAGWSLATTEVNVAASLSAMQGDTDSAMAMLSDFELGPLDVDAHLIPEGIGWLALLSEQFDLAVMSFSDAASLAERDGVRGTAATSWRAGAARALAATDDLRAARELATESVSISRSFGAPGPLTLSLGAMAATGLGDPLELLAEAVESADRSQEPLLALRSRLELGIALHNEGYDAKAIEVLRVAGDAAHKLGVPTISEAVIAGLRACGSRPVRLAIQGIEALTPAQLRVVRLAAGGATNAEIATTLFINIKTVESHLARAFRKLGVRSRNELPALLDA